MQRHTRRQPHQQGQHGSGTVPTPSPADRGGHVVERGQPRDRGEDDDREVAPAEPGDRWQPARHRRSGQPLGEERREQPRAEQHQREHDDPEHQGQHVQGEREQPGPDDPPVTAQPVHDRDCVDVDVQRPRPRPQREQEADRDDLEPPAPDHLCEGRRDHLADRVGGQEGAARLLHPGLQRGHDVGPGPVADEPDAGHHPQDQRRQREQREEGGLGGEPGHPVAQARAHGPDRGPHDRPDPPGRAAQSRSGPRGGRRYGGRAGDGPDRRPGRRGVHHGARRRSGVPDVTRPRVTSRRAAVRTARRGVTRNGLGRQTPGRVRPDRGGGSLP